MAILPRSSRLLPPLLQSPFPRSPVNYFFSLLGCLVYYRSLVRPLLFLGDPESAHERISAVMRGVSALPGAMSALSRLLVYHSPRLESHHFGIHFPNPVGLAAGFDKTGALYPFLAQAGFGFVECGTFTAEGQPGNSRPRLFRFPAQQVLINQMGFNNPGAAAAAKTLQRQDRVVPRGISIGKTRRTPLGDVASDHRKSISLLAPFADYFALNISSPNTPGLRTLEKTDLLRQVLHQALSDIRSTTLQRPLFLKLAPDQDDRDFELSVSAAVEAGAAGLILTNTTLSRAGAIALTNISGGLSGEPLRQRATDLVRRAHRLTQGRVPLVGVGGIFSGADALEKIRAGASLIQIYTGYVFEGPRLPRRIARYLDRTCFREGRSLSQLTGSQP